MTNLLKDKVIIVTGGAGLLGRQFIKTIVENGGIGIIADISKENGEKFKFDLQTQTPDAKVEYVFLDITSKESTTRMIAWVYQKYGKIDGLVNSAYPRNKNYGRKFEDVTYEDFCENVNLHLGGYFLTSQQVALFFKKQGYGNIINIASIYGVIAPRFKIYEGTDMTMPVEYSAIKSAIIHLTKYMNNYFKGSNIRINSISPGGILDSQPESFLECYKRFSNSKGMLNAEDLSGTLVYLLSDLSKYVCGQNIVVDDGWTI